jgi:hypothetical protein
MTHASTVVHNAVFIVLLCIVMSTMYSIMIDHTYVVKVSLIIVIAVYCIMQVHCINVTSLLHIATAHIICMHCIKSLAKSLHLGPKLFI